MVAKEKLKSGAEKYPNTLVAEGELKSRVEKYHNPLVAPVITTIPYIVYACSKTILNNIPVNLSI
jgi:hypothetical protein